MRLVPDLARGFIAMLLEDSGGRKKPLLPSLTQLVMADFSLYSLSLLPLYDALRMRVEQGVPVKMLDPRMCRPHPDDRVLGVGLTVRGICSRHYKCIYVLCPIPIPHPTNVSVDKVDT